jgi:hypothetical protein
VLFLNCNYKKEEKVGATSGVPGSENANRPSTRSIDLFTKVYVVMEATLNLEKSEDMTNWKTTLVSIK